MSDIVLYVMTQKGYQVTKALLADSDIKISHVVIGKDKSIANDFHSEIKNICDSYCVSWSLREDKFVADPSQYIFAVSWRWMIDHPMNRLIVFHDSLLPKYRGFAPLVNSLINGEPQIGVSAIYGAAEYDRGELIGQESCCIEYPIKIYDAINANMDNFIRLSVRIAKHISGGSTLISTAQNDAEATYSIWRNEDDYYIDWSKSSDEILRHINAVGFPYLGAKSHTSVGPDITVHEASVIPDVYCELRHVGKVIFIENGFPVIICGAGLIKIHKATYFDGTAEKSFLPLAAFRVKFF